MRPECHQCVGHPETHHKSAGCLGGRKIPDVCRGHSKQLQELPIYLLMGWLWASASEDLQNYCPVQEFEYRHPVDHRVGEGRRLSSRRPLLKDSITRARGDSAKAPQCAHSVIRDPGNLPHPSTRDGKSGPDNRYNHGSDATTLCRGGSRRDGLHEPPALDLALWVGQCRPLGDFRELHGVDVKPPVNLGGLFGPGVMETHRSW